jgi:hypothetical protein
MAQANVSPLSGDMSSFFFSLGMVKVFAADSKQSKRQGAPSFMIVMQWFIMPMVQLMIIGVTICPWKRKSS